MDSHSEKMVVPSKLDSSEAPVISIEESASETVPRSSSPEKQRARCDEIEGMNVIGLTDEELECYNNFTPAMRRKLNRKVDIHLLPWLAVLYFVSHIDRGTIGNAKVEGMATDLGMTGVQYNTALAVFFISYILFEIPSNIILKQISRPSWYLGGLTVAYGIIMIGHGFVHHFSALAGCRFLLGIFEAGFMPAALYLCSVWYMPTEVSVRMGGFYFTGALSGAFAGLLAAAISQMDGVAGLEGWRWIFILEGIATVVIGCVSTFCLVDMPHTSISWLTPEEHRFLQVGYKIKQGGMTIEGSDVDGSVVGLDTMRELKAIFTDWKLCTLFLCIIPQGAGFYAWKFTLPTITKSMGFSNTNAQLLSAPPYVLSAIGAIVIPKLSDYTHKRAYWIWLCFILMAIANAVLLGLQGHMAGNRLGAAYTFVCIGAFGTYSAAPMLGAWAGNNSAPAGRRALVMACLISIGNLGGIVGSFMFMEKEAPVYNTGFGLGTALGVFGVVTAFILWAAYRKENAKNEKISLDEARARYSDEELLALGNKSPLFRYFL